MNQIVKAFFIAVVGLVPLACANDQSNSNQDSHESHEHEHQETAKNTSDKKPLSPRTTAMGNIGEAHIHIDYSSPSVRGRTIWGGLVAYDQVWVTGAHKATSIDFSAPVTLNGQSIPAGKYGFFTIPGRESWQVIINKNYDQHLADEYDQGEDVLRLETIPKTLDQPVEALTYEVNSTGSNAGTIAVKWELLEISIDVEVK